MFPLIFEPTISAGERPHTYALDRVATGSDTPVNIFPCIFLSIQQCW